MPHHLLGGIAPPMAGRVRSEAASYAPVSTNSASVQGELTASPVPFVIRLHDRVVTVEFHVTATGPLDLSGPAHVRPLSEDRSYRDALLAAAEARFPKMPVRSTTRFWAVSSLSCSHSTAIAG